MVHDVFFILTFFFLRLWRCLLWLVGHFLLTIFFGVRVLFFFSWDLLFSSRRLDRTRLFKRLLSLLKSKKPVYTPGTVNNFLVLFSLTLDRLILHWWPLGLLWFFNRLTQFRLLSQLIWFTILLFNSLDILVCRMLGSWNTLINAHFIELVCVSTTLLDLSKFLLEILLALNLCLRWFMGGKEVFGITWVSV